jgi:hypothetical protein
MDDEFDVSGIDERLRRAVRADAATARRTVEAALSAGMRRRSMRARRRPMLIAAAVAAAVVGAAVAGWRSRSVPPLPSRAGSLSIRGSGATLVVDDADGPRWIVRRSDQARPNGGYVIVLPQ